ncbi:hypothetical protein J8L98_07425 [Pseudoalteromonas sp. MMG013]|uniref:hypothetical protein n=1 Tax=Pseudoalteromonas sp. MMG013 TaxID=2822687 RepID=UPI001B37C68C|nr:hypothetical protein [Pseudoalteromonas sp. MMG013]MBQ4861518.1 hypothetical protein [Pseudoalteromonas sp. MMG013]
MSKQFNDDDIIKLYQHNTDDLPPRQLDEVILARAAQEVKVDEKPVNTKTNRWWPYSGIAAAMVAVVVLAPWQYDQDPVFVSIESADINGITQAHTVVNEAELTINKARRKVFSDEPVIAHETTQNIAASGPQLEMTDQPQVESIVVTGMTVERAVPEHRGQTIKPASSALYGIALSEPLPEFAKIIIKLGNNDQQGAEEELIKLLEEKPEYHEGIPEPLEAVYQALLKNGKLQRPLQ